MPRSFLTLRTCQEYFPHTLLAGGLAGILMLAAAASTAVAAGSENMFSLPKSAENSFEICENMLEVHNFGNSYYIWAGSRSGPYSYTVWPGPGPLSHIDMWGCLTYEIGEFTNVIVTLVSDTLGNPYCGWTWEGCFDQNNTMWFSGCDPAAEVRFDVYDESWYFMGSATVPYTYISYDYPSCDA